MPGPLSGYRIVDVTQMISGPMATMILADQGADVIKVEPPVERGPYACAGGTAPSNVADLRYRQPQQTLGSD